MVTRYTCTDELRYLWERDDGDLVTYEEYEWLQTAAKKALEALQWSVGGEPLPTLEIEAIKLLKKELEG